MFRKLYYTTVGGVCKNGKIGMYLRGIWLMLEPKWWCRYRASRILAAYDSLPVDVRQRVDRRVSYYCALPEGGAVDASAMPVLADNHFLADRAKAYPTEIATRKGRLAGPVSYFFDTYEFTRCFPQHLHWMIAGGDVSQQQAEPTITKSRPVLEPGGCSNNVLMKLNRIRHFIFFRDPFAWEEKVARVVFRGVVRHKPRRRQFLDMWQHHPMCDLRDGGGMAIYDHLRYRYIMALEGNDVASNLKWVMSSGSIAVMPRPTCETWFMEGCLIPDYHYICIADDYHDLIDKVMYYEAHPDAARAIVRHANEWVRQFQDEREERLVSLRVMQKYLSYVNQQKP